MSKSPASPKLSVANDGDTEVNDFVCTACGFMCDDLRLTIRENRITTVSPSCPQAERFLMAEDERIDSPYLVDGQPRELETALDRAAEILQSAAAPLVMGLERATTESQRLAVAIADRLGAVIDPTDERGASRCHAAIQTAGAVTATLGEVAARSDLVVYWNVDPAETHPRHMERFARRPPTPSRTAPESRRVITVAPARSKTSQASDEFLEVLAGGDIAALATLRALLRGVGVDANDVRSQTGAGLEQWAYLAQRLQLARYAAIFYEPTIGDSGGPAAVTQAITDLVRELHGKTRAVALRIGAPWNAVGAAQVLTWQTGFPAAVDLSPGYPSYRPGESSAQTLLERGEVDAALVIGADPGAHLPAGAQTHLASIPIVVIDDRPTKTSDSAQVALFTARFGIETAGSVYRSDGVALPLRPALKSQRKDAEELLRRLLHRLTQRPK